jgi:hypothetical protein
VCVCVCVREREREREREQPRHKITSRDLSEGLVSPSSGPCFAGRWVAVLGKQEGRKRQMGVEKEQSEAKAHEPLVSPCRSLHPAPRTPGF